MWLDFFLFIAVMLAVDIFSFGGGILRLITTKAALGWSIVWALMALVFNALLWLYLNSQHDSQLTNQKALEFFTGYIIEKSLSIENKLWIALVLNFVALRMFPYFVNASLG